MTWTPIADQSSSFSKASASSQLNPDESIQDSSSWDLTSYDDFLGSSEYSWEYSNGLLRKNTTNGLNSIFLEKDYFYGEEGKTYRIEFDFEDYTPDHDTGFGIISAGIGWATSAQGEQFRTLPFTPYPSSFSSSFEFTVDNSTQSTVDALLGKEVGNVIVIIDWSGSPDSVPVGGYTGSIRITRVSIYQLFNEIADQSTSWTKQSESTSWSNISDQSTTWS